MSNRGLTKSYDTSAPVAKRRIVKFTADGVVAQASAATDLSIGVSDQSADVPQGRRCDVHRSGLVEIEVGGAIPRGSKVTADANGKAVVAAPAAGSNVQIIGIAEKTWAAGDFGDFFLAPSVMQG